MAWPSSSLGWAREPWDANAGGRTLTWKPNGRGRSSRGVRVQEIQYGTSTLKGLLGHGRRPLLYCARVAFSKSLRRRRRRPDLSEAPFAPRGRPRPLVFNNVQPELCADAILLNGFSRRMIQCKAI
jgi:hypothetical protein